MFTTILITLIALVNCINASPLSSVPKFALQIHAPGRPFHKAFLTLLKTEGHTLVVDVGENYNDLGNASGSSINVSFQHSLKNLIYSTKQFGTYRLANRGKVDDDAWFVNKPGKYHIGTVDVDFKWTSGIEFDNQGLMSIGGNSPFSVGDTGEKRSFINVVNTRQAYYIEFSIGKPDKNLRGTPCVPVQVRKVE